MDGGKGSIGPLSQLIRLDETGQFLENGLFRMTVMRINTDAGTNAAYKISNVKSAGNASGNWKSRIITENPAATIVEKEITRTEIYLIR